MSMFAEAKTPGPSAGIYQNALHLNDDMPQEVAKWVLELGFTERDHERIEDLAAKNNEGKLTESERREFEGYVILDDIIGTLQTKALEVVGQ